MILRDTPPSSPQMRDDEEFDEDDMVYIGDADEVLDALEAGSESEDEMEEVPIKDDAVRVFSTHEGTQSLFLACLSLYLILI